MMGPLSILGQVWKGVRMSEYSVSIRNTLKLACLFAIHGAVKYVILDRFAHVDLIVRK